MIFPVTALPPRAFPAAASPGSRLQVPMVFLKAESLSSTSLIFFLSAANPGKVSRVCDWATNKRYMCHASSEKVPNPDQIVYETDEETTAVAEGPQVTVSVGYNGHESGIPVVFTSEGTSERDGQDEGSEGVDRKIAKIKAMLGSMSDGEISISAYDTAWVALVPNLSGAGVPQFPSSLKWVEENQLADGSWGDGELFNVHDRLLNTLACVIALKSWGVCPDRSQRGISFLQANMKRLDEDDPELMPIGFEVAFPSLVEIARTLDLDVPLDFPALEGIYARRSLKLKRIPKDLLHEVPTTLLHSLEGMAGLEWEKILRLQCADGSLLFSPSSTAFALMCTGDIKCFDYLQRTVRRFNGGAPSVYPVDLFERLWAVDRLERLGISRYFPDDIRRCLDYVYKYWTPDGISWARSSRVQDVDDTAMGFRLLRLHGYDVSPDVFLHFEKEGEFFCLPGQSTQAITGMYNLNRAAQLSYPGEEILQAAKSFSNKYLRERRALNDLSDKWIITKDLPGEVGYALEFPWYASLPRVETRFYLEQYGGDHDVWIGKTLYRMPYVNNDDFLEFARSDFRRCQALHKQEWLGLQRWFEDSGLRGRGVTRKNLLTAYFVAAASVFEPERAAERLGWARTAVLVDAVSAHLAACGGERAAACFLDEMRRSLSTYADGNTVPSVRSRTEKCTGRGLLGSLLRTLDLLALDACASPPATHSQIRRHLRRAWEDWTLSRRVEEDDTGLLVVRSLELCAGRTGIEESLIAGSNRPSGPQQCHAELARLISSLSRRLRPLGLRGFPVPTAVLGDGEDAGGIGDAVVDLDMQELVMLVLRNNAGAGRCTLQTFLAVAKSLYYVASCPPAALELHVDKVLFQAIG